MGLTFKKGVIADMGNHTTDRDNYWLNMYVLLSRATCMEDLLLFRMPAKSVFDEGPPAYLRDFLSRLRVENGPLEVTLKQACASFVLCHS